MGTGTSQKSLIVVTDVESLWIHHTQACGRKTTIQGGCPACLCYAKTKLNLLAIRRYPLTLIVIPIHVGSQSPLVRVVAFLPGGIYLFRPFPPLNGRRSLSSRLAHPTLFPTCAYDGPPEVVPPSAYRRGCSTPPYGEKVKSQKDELRKLQPRSTPYHPSSLVWNTPDICKAHRACLV